MKKRIISIASCLLFVGIFLCGCKSEQDNWEESKKIESSETLIEVYVSEEVEQKEIVEEILIETVETENEFQYREEQDGEATKYIMCGDFSEGMALLYTQEKGGYYSFIDKSGKVLFNVKEKTLFDKVSSFANGYAYIETDNKVTIIDKTGAIRSSYDITSTISVLAYGYGYILIQEYISSFDEAYYVVKVLDANGNLLDEKKVENTIRAEHLGKGVFLIKDYEYNLYCANNNNWVFCEVLDDDLQFFQDIAVTGVQLINSSEESDGAIGKLHLLDVNGNIEIVNLNIEIGWGWKASPIINDYCVLCDYSDWVNPIILYNLKTESFKSINNYLDKINWEVAYNTKILVHNSRVAIPMIGNDGNNYISIFDTDCNMIGEPILMADYDPTVMKIHGDPYYGFNDNRLVVKNANDGYATNQYSIYDENGEIVFELDLSLYDNKYIYGGYSEEVLCAGTQDGTPRYFDVSGNLLFESIDNSEAITLEF